MAGDRQLPAGFNVEPRGMGEERHVLLDIEGSTFELHPADAIALGHVLVAVGTQTDEAEEPPA